MTIAFTFLVGGLFGLLFYRMRVPGGVTIGAIFGMIVLSFVWREPSVPYTAKLLAQITAGAFIGATIERDDLARMSHNIGPAIMVILSFLALNLCTGFLLRALFSFDLLTAFLCAIPAGMGEVTLIAADMGGDVTKVVVMQFTRLCAGLGIFPALVVWVARKRHEYDTTKHTGGKGRHNLPEATPSPPKTVLLTFAVSALFGLLGLRSGMPAGTLAFAMLGTLLLKLRGMHIVLPRKIRRLAQVLSGTYIGCSVSPQTIRTLPQLLLPALLITCLYIFNAFLIGWVLHKKFHLQLSEAMLMLSPAGVSDMALIAADLGVENPSLVVVQVLRLIAGISVFPQICFFVAGQFS